MTVREQRMSVGKPCLLTREAFACLRSAHGVPYWLVNPTPSTTQSRHLAHARQTAQIRSARATARSAGPSVPSR